MRDIMRQPDESREINVEGGRVVAYSFGNGEETILLLHGGPGIRSDYLSQTHGYLADHGFHVVTYDQLGSGKSDRPDNPELWTLDRYVREVEAVCQALGLKRVHLYGHSWGVILAIEYALTHPSRVKSLVLANGLADWSFHVEETNRLLREFNPEFARRWLDYEMRGDTANAEFQAMNTLIYCRHVCRINPWPEEFVSSMADFNLVPFRTMFFSEFLLGGRHKYWNRLHDLRHIAAPTLVLVGEHDLITPNESWLIHSHIADSRLKIFSNAAHMPFWECPEEYLAETETFWRTHQS